MRNMKKAASQSGSKSAADGESNDVDKYFVSQVKKRQEKVDRLKGELGALNAHLAKLVESFSVPTYPQGYDPVAGRSDENGASDTGNKARTTPSSHAPGGSEQRQSPSSKTRDEVEFADGADGIEEGILLPTVRNPIPTETLSSSTSASDSEEARNVMDFTNAKDIDTMKDEIRRERPGPKTPRKLPATFNGIPTRISEKKPETGSSSSDDSDSSCGESSNSESSSDESDEFETEEPESDEFETEEPESDEPDVFETEEPDSDEPNASDSEEVSPQEISSGSALDSLTKQKLSPLKMKSALSGEKAKTTWKPESKAPSSSSEDSGESSSSSDEEDDRNKLHAQTVGASLGRAKEPEMPKPVPTTSLSPNASPEDVFDWIVLGLQGPWLPLASIEEPSGASELKDQALPLKFPSTAVYAAMFQKLIREEAKAILFSEWEQYKAEQDLNAESTTESPNFDSRGQSSIWQLRSMVQTMGDPFHYFGAECIEGQNLKFDTGEFLCMIVPRTGEVKAVAIVNHQERYQAPLLKTRAPWDSPLDKCVLLRLCNMVTLRRMFLAVSTLSDIFSPLQQQILDPLANRKFLAPLPVPEELERLSDGDPKLKLNSESLRNFSDRKILNTLQLLTVSSLLHMRQGFQLVQGPPGTGKTSTIIGMVSTLLIEEPGVRVLVCAPSNAALDEVAFRLVHRMIDKSGKPYSPMDGTVVRFGAKRVMHPTVQLISLDSLALKSSSHRSRAWVDILDAASVVCATLSGCGNPVFDELEKLFDVIIIDEAAQAVEAEVLIALKRVKGRCAMVGDPQQLPATVFQRPSAAYGRSLFERFQEGGVPVHLLTTQYRMHPSICSYPSQQFYKGALRDSTQTSSMVSIFSAEVCGRGTTVRGCRFKLGHYSFMDVGWGSEREELVSHSRANYEEALVVCNVVEGVVRGLLPGLKPNVGVITPYIAQRGVIERELEKRGIDTTACEVNTVDGFQGREKDVIVLSCVRAMADRGLGFVSDERRMNVALTRAKNALIIVGHAETLQKWSPAWGSLIDDARKRGYYQVLTKNKNQDIPSRNWKPSPSPQKDMYRTVEVEEQTMPTTADTKSTKNANGKQDKGKVRKDGDDTQKPSRNSERAGVGEKADGNTKVKRKREASEVEGGKKTAVDIPTIKKKKKKKKKKGKSTENSSDLLLHPKKKIKLKENVPESSEKKRKELKVESDVAEPSGTTRPRKKLKEVKQEFPKDKMPKMKIVICLTAPALTPAQKVRTGKKTARCLKSSMNLKKPKEEIPENGIESSTEGRKVGTAELLPGTTSVEQEEVTVYEVTSSAPGDDHNNSEKTQTPVERPADPVPQSTDRNTGTERRNRGWFPNCVSEDDRHSLHNRQLPPRSVHPSHSASPTRGFDEHAAASRQPHWGNSYDAPSGPHNRFRGHDMDMTTNNLYSVLTRTSSDLGMQPNNHGDFQEEPRNRWQHSHPAHIPPHWSQFGTNHQFINPGHRQPPRRLGPTNNHNSCNTYFNQHNSQSTQWRGRGRGRGRGRRGHSGGRSGGRQSYSYPGR